MQKVNTFLFFFLFTNAIIQAQFTSQHPIIFIETNGQEIIDEPDILAEIKVIDHGDGMPHSSDDPFTYEGFITIELRGNSSQGFDKKSYGFETSDANGVDMDTTLLGFPSEEDWILYSGWADKTFLRNALSMKLSREMGHYASRTRFCEVFLDGEYEGLYVLMEKIKRDKNRLDIAKLTETDIVGEPASGGYILKFDWHEEDGWEANSETVTGNDLYIQYVYPKVENLQDEQREYIHSYIDSFELALFADDYTNSFGKHYSEYADVNSFIDLFIINELSKNVDAYKLSTFIHKDRAKNGGKLKGGPIWDYDIAWYNSSYCAGGQFSGWIYNEEDCEDLDLMPLWWERFLGDTFFLNKLCLRWNELRQNILAEDALMDWIDEQAAFIDAAQERNYDRWDSLEEWTWDHPEIAGSYQGEVDLLKNFIQQRIEWIDEQIDCSSLSNQLAEDTTPILKVYPIPVINDELSIDLQLPRNQFEVELIVYNINGQLVHFEDLTNPFYQFFTKINTTHWSTGNYILHLQTDDFQLERKITISK